MFTSKITCCSTWIQALKHIGHCNGDLWCFTDGICTWLKNIENQEGLLDGDYVGSLKVVLMGVIVGNLVGEPDGDKSGFWLGRIIGTPWSRNVFNLWFSVVLAQWD